MTQLPHTPSRGIGGLKLKLIFMQKNEESAEQCYLKIILSSIFDTHTAWGDEQPCLSSMYLRDIISFSKKADKQMAQTNG